MDSRRLPLVAAGSPAYAHGPRARGRRARSSGSGRAAGPRWRWWSTARGEHPMQPRRRRLVRPAPARRRARRPLRLSHRRRAAARRSRLAAAGRRSRGLVGAGRARAATPGATRTGPGPRRTGQVIYELHVGTFTPEGTWAAAAEKLPHLAGARGDGDRDDAGRRVPRPLRLGLRRRPALRPDPALRRARRPARLRRRRAPPRDRGDPRRRLQPLRARATASPR